MKFSNFFSLFLSSHQDLDGRLSCKFTLFSNLQSFSTISLHLIVILKLYNSSVTSGTASTSLLNMSWNKFAIIGQPQPPAVTSAVAS